MTDSYTTPQNPTPPNSFDPNREGNTDAAAGVTPVPPPPPTSVTPPTPVSPASATSISAETQPDPAVFGVPPQAPPLSGEPRHSTDPEPASDADSQDRTDQAKDAAQEVAGDAQEAGRAVKDTAVDEAAEVKDDAVQEAKGLGDEAASMLKSQASGQMQRAAQTVRTFSDDVDRMAHGKKPEPGPAADLVDQLNSRADAAATWLETHEPIDALHEVQRFARKRPVAFLAITAGIGFAAGRLTRGMTQDRTENEGEQQPRQAPAPVSGAPGSGVPAYDTEPGASTPGYTGESDPYAGGGSR